MSGVNKVILIGNLGKDPEVKHLDNGKVVANVTLATTEKYKNKRSEVVQDTEWHNLELWGKTAELAENYLRKGSSIYVEGKIKSDEWQDDQGNKRKTTKVKVLSMTFLGSPEAKQESIAPKEEDNFNDSDDDLPF